MKKKNIIGLMLILVAVMAVGYAAFSTTLTINGTANISSTWNVLFTEIKQLSKTSGVSEKSLPEASGTTATFDVDLTSPGDSIDYQITIENKGSIDAKIESITATETGSDAIVFEITNIKEGQTLLKNSSKTFNVKVSYKDVTDQPNITINKLMVSINCVQLIGSSNEGDAPEIVTQKLAARILKDNTAYADNIRSPYVNSDTGIDFSQVSSAENGEGLYYTNKNTDGGKTTYYFRGDVENNYVALGDDVYVDGFCTAKGYENNSELTPLKDILSESECLAVENACIMYASFSVQTDEVQCQSEIEWGAGEWVETVWVPQKILVSSSPRFRIIRINEDGSVRLMSTTGVGMSGGMGSNDLNDYRTEYKRLIQTWFDNNLAIYSSNLISNNFCFENKVINRVETLDPWYGTNDIYNIIYTHEANDRLVTNKSPKFGCSVAKDGGYVDLITADEVAYGGGVIGQQITGYLSEFNYEKLAEDYYNDYYSFMTGTVFKHSEVPNGSEDVPFAYFGAVQFDGNFTKDNYFGSTSFFPVINVKGDVKVVKGTGTSGSPYVLQMN